MPKEAKERRRHRAHPYKGADEMELDDLISSVQPGVSELASLDDEAAEDGKVTMRTLKVEQMKEARQLRSQIEKIKTQK